MLTLFIHQVYSEVELPYLTLQHRIFIEDGDTGKTITTEKMSMLRKP